MANTLHNHLLAQHAAQQWRAACADCIIDLQTDYRRRFMFLF